jgi:hypothetical protein
MKMKNNNITLIIITLTCIASFFSCKKYFALQPTSSFDQTYVFSSALNAKSAVLGVYNSLAGDQGYGGRLNYYYTVDNDETTGLLGSSGGGDNSVKSMSRYNMTPSNAQLELPFNQLYSGIEKANICIKNIPAMDLYTNGSPADKATLQRLYGEALTLRAQFYFDLVKIWGDVPAPFVPSTDATDLFLPKTDQDVIYEHVLNDLKLAETLVPWRNDPGVDVDERITKGAVKGLRARIALFRGGYALRRTSGVMERKPDYLTYYQIAHDECNDIMQSGKHSLNPSFQAIFKDNIDAHKIETNGEVLFEVAMGGGTGLADGKVGNIDGTRVNLYGQAAIFITPTYLYAFDTLDTRRDVTIAAYTINASNYKIGLGLIPNSAIVSAKFRADWVTNPVIPPTSTLLYQGINWPLIRYSDILLMFAESENEINSGPTAAAMTAYEQVRKRGFKGNESKIGVTPTDKTGFFNAIVNERSFEFGGEGLRKYDLMRWNLLYQKLLDTRTNLNKMQLRQAPYQNVPTAAYYKNNSTDLLWYSSLYKPAPAVTPTGYTKLNWTSSFSIGFTNSIGELFQPNHNELFPLPQAIISSNPKLKQDYGY